MDFLIINIKHTLEALFSPNIDEPVEWQKLVTKATGEVVYFKSQNPYTYTEAKEYCNRQEIGEKSTRVGTHPSQLWKFNQTDGTLKNEEGIWTSPKDISWEMQKSNTQVGAYNVWISGTKKNLEKKDSSVTPDDNKKATNKSEEQGILKAGIEKINSVWSDLVDAWDTAKGSFWLRWEETDDRTNTVFPGKKPDKKWIKSEPNSRGYFTLQYPGTEKFLTATDNGSLQIRGMYYIPSFKF